MKIPSWYIPRRTVLRSAGVSLALPFLDAMVKPGARAAAAAPRRFIALWSLPCGTVAKRDQVQNSGVAPWTPAGSGPLANLTPDMYLKPFFDANVQSKISILTGLQDRQSVSHNCGGLLGSNLPPGDGPAENSDGPMVGRNGSADYVIANEIKRQNPNMLHSLILSAAQANSGGVGGTFRNYVSFTPTQPLPLERNPRNAFEALFGSNATLQDAAPEAKAEAMRRQLYDFSVLDSVGKDATSLMARLGRSDRQKLDQYMTGVRDLEEKMKRAGAPLVGCMPGTAPAAPAADFLTNNANLDVRVGLMMDLMIKGLECDRTRVMTLMYTSAYGMNGFPHLMLPNANHHAVSHYGSNSPLGKEASIAWMDKFTVWALGRYAYLLKELDRRTEADGSTLLDNCVVYGTGSEHCDSSGHTSASMPVILGGRGGRDAAGGWAIASGRHVRYPAWPGGSETMLRLRGHAPGDGRTVRDLLWAIIELCGPKLSAFGEANKPLDLKWADATAS